MSLLFEEVKGKILLSIGKCAMRTCIVSLSTHNSKSMDFRFVTTFKLLTNFYHLS